jgi:hypothetical protein
MEHLVFQFGFNDYGHPREHALRARERIRKFTEL